MFRKFALAFVLLIALGLFQPLLACSCAESGPPCQAWGTSDSIFLGRVVNISSYQVDSGGPLRFSETLIRVRFEVESAYRGVPTRTVEVVTSANSGSGCGYPFERNGRYVVYAGMGSDNSLSTSSCTRTRRVENAADDISFFNGLATAPMSARVFGQLGIRERDSVLSNPRVGPAAGARVTVEGSGRMWNTVSDAQGRYEIAGLPAGKYEVKAQFAPGGLSQFEPATQFVELVERGCVEANAFSQTIGRISGWLYDPDGRPVPNQRVDLMPEGMSPLDRTPFELPSAWSAEDGSYKLQGLPPGRYRIGVNLKYPPTPIGPDGFVYARTYFPAAAERSDAQVIVLAAGDDQAGVNLKLPKPLQKREVRGIVMWSDGKRAKGAHVFLANPDYLPGSSLFGETDSDGAFSISAYEGQAYAITANSSTDHDGKKLVGNGVQSSPTPVRGDQTVVTIPLPATLVGRLVDVRGRPIAGSIVNLVPEDVRSLESMIHSTYRITFSNAEGRFELTGLEPRRYVLGIHPFSPPYPSNQEDQYASTFYPGSSDRNAAEVIEFHEGQKVELKDFVLPERLHVGKVEGVVVWTQGQAVQEGWVMAKDVEFSTDSVISTEVGRDGRFTLELFMGRKYIIYASADRDQEKRNSLWPIEGKSEEMVFDSPTRGVTIRVPEVP